MDLNLHNLGIAGNNFSLRNLLILYLYKPTYFIYIDRYEGDSKFIENLREFKGYMITLGYKEEVVDQAFGKLANISRKVYCGRKQMQQERKGMQENIVLLYRMNLHFQTSERSY